MTSREQFEEWFSNDVAGADVNFPDFEEGEYIAGEVYDDQLYIMLQAMWMAWQASRAAVDVEILSEPFIAIKKDATNYDFYNAGIESAKRAIVNAGIKVKDC